MVASIVVLSTQICNTKMRSSKLINRSDAQKQIIRFGFGREFHDLNYFELYLFINFIYLFFHILWIHHTLGVIIKYFCTKSSLQCNFIMLYVKFWQLLVQYQHLHTHLHHLLKYVHFFWDCFCQHKLLDFVNQYVYYMLMIFFSLNSKLEYCFETLWLKHVQVSRVVHFTMQGFAIL